MTDWCILRCRGSNTLRLARSLSDIGFEAWTPTELQVRKPKRGKHIEAIVAAAPTYAFARGRHLPDLLDITEGPQTQHPQFSLFRHHADGRFAFVDDRDIYRMRQVERIAAAKAQPLVFNTGQEILIPDGPFQGLTGTVIQNSKGEYTLIAFEGFAIPIKFATWTLAVAA